MPISLVLYGSTTGNSRRTSIALEEAGLAFVPRRLDLSAGAQRSPEHLARNPRGRVPVLVATDEHGDELVFTQSNAIQLWADTQAPGLLLPRDGLARTVAIERWLHIVTDVVAPSNAVSRLRRAGLLGDASAHLDREAADALGEAQRFLGDSPFIGGDAFSLADIAAYTIAVYYESALDWSRLPRLRRWFDAVGARDAVRRGMTAFD